MAEWLLVTNLAVTALSLLLALLVLVRVVRMNRPGTSVQDQLVRVLRTENDLARQAADGQARILRQEVNDNLRGFHETTVKTFRELGEVLASQIRDFGSRLDVGLKQISERTTGISTKLDSDIAHMAEEANQHRELLRHAIEIKLDGAASQQAGSAKEARPTVGQSKIKFSMFRAWSSAGSFFHRMTRQLVICDSPSGAQRATDKENSISLSVAWPRDTSRKPENNLTRKTE
jgi:methyl-accepting chemotaxis protein